MSLAAAVCSLSLSAAVPHHKAAAVASPWQVAEAAHAQLEEIPPAERSATDYHTVMDAYRLIYHANPGDPHAPESVFTVGNLLAEQGVVLRDPHALQAALGQYEFLRKQYPTSSLRIAAALEEAHVAVAGLHDRALAKEKYTAFLQEFPKSQHAAEAREDLAVLKLGTLPEITSGPLAKAEPVDRNVNSSGSVQALPKPEPTGLANAPALQTAARLQTEAAASSSGVAQSTVAPSERAEATAHASERSATPREQALHAAIDPQQAAHDDTPSADLHAAAASPKPGKPAQVTGIRHWSTPTYTRVAIDLGSEVQYEAARVPHPDRIYFDLHNTRLAQDLQGKNFDVTDDGFLKRIRAAQYTADSTRVVLDVNDVTEYSAFLLPNPYRLIIDIHGGPKVPATSAGQGSPQASHTAATAAAPSASAALAGPVPSTVPVQASGTTRDVTRLSQQPGKVDATTQPTSQPIAVIADRSVSPAPSASAKRAPKPGRDIASRDSGSASQAKGMDRTVDHGTSRTTAVTSLPSSPGSDLGSVRTALPTAEGQRSLSRALGLKVGRIVIDPGHGGHDSGTLGAGGIMEKDVVLDVALRLGKLLHDHLGAEIIYTRSDDTFIPLETRTAIANSAQADLFLSIHANSSKDESARGVETYYLNFTSDPVALDVAARENAVSDQSVSELSSMVKKITLKDKIDESREFAADVEQSLYTGLQKGNTGLKNRGVKKAPFVVLIGANMPSILAEISFVTNPADAAELRTGEYRERVAESIYKGVARYAQGLGGMRVADTAAPAGHGTN